MTRDPENDSDWLAFQYLAGELSKSKAAEFESRLGEDEAAQRALGRMVELSLAVSAAGPAVFEACGAAVERPEVRRATRRFGRGLVWLAVSALVLVAALVSMRGSLVPPGDAVFTAAEEDSWKLAVIWNETRAEMPADVPWPENENLGEAAHDLAIPMAAEAAGDWNTETPAWIWAGVIAANAEELEHGPADPGGI
jgi:anti-sigma factor RsiW